MSANLVIRDFAGRADSDGNLQYRWENTSNAPIADGSDVTWLGDGRATADQYTLEFLNGAPATLVKVTCNSKNEAYSASKSVTCDNGAGDTINKDIVPGVGLIFDPATTTGWKCVVSTGAYMDGSGNMSERLDFGVVEADTDTSLSYFAVSVENIGADDAQNCELISLPGCYHDDTTFIYSFDNHTTDAYDKLGTTIVGDHTLSFTDRQGPVGGFYNYDVYVDDPTCSVAANLAITNAVFDGSTVYQYGVSGYDDSLDLLAGFGICFHDIATNPVGTDINFTIYDGSTWVMMSAADAGGSPTGGYSNSDLTLTEIGETAGTITAGGYAKAFFYIDLPSAAAIGDMRRINIKARGLTV